MRAKYALAMVLAVSFVVSPCLAQNRIKLPPKPAATSAPAADEVITPQSGPIPDSVIKAIEAQFANEPKSIQDSISIMKNVLDMCKQAQKKYPDADNISKIQVPMLQAASWIAGYTRDPAANEEMLSIARQILASKSPVAQKFSADVILTIASFQPLDGPAISNEEIEKNIRNFIARYEKTDVAPNAYMVGVRL
ncbi:MAG: hypothetical protein EHM48_07960, partial [Planctomycetaceae bacterium]